MKKIIEKNINIHFKHFHQKTFIYFHRYLEKSGFVLCVGSKNVHMIVRNHNDIEKYTDSRFQVARTVAGSVLDLVLSRPNDGGLEVDNLTLLLNFLHHTRFTSVFEILQLSSISRSVVFRPALHCQLL